MRFGYFGIEVNSNDVAFVGCDFAVTGKIVLYVGVGGGRHHPPTTNRKCKAVTNRKHHYRRDITTMVFSGSKENESTEQLLNGRGKPI